MRFRSLSGMCVVSLSAAAIAFSACGSSSGKKSVPHYDAGGEGGDGAGGDATSGSGGNAGKGGSGISGDAGNGTLGGEPSMTEAGAAGTTNMEPLGGAGGDGNVKPFHGLYVGPAPSGNDATGDGTVAKPFATLAKVAGVAQAGDTIVFLNGTYNTMDDVLTSTVIPDGVDLMAETPGGVTLTGNNNLALFKLAGSSLIEGFKFNVFQSVVQFVDAATATGTLTIKDSSFKNCSVQCLSLSGTTTTNIEVAADAVLGDGTYNFAILTKQASLNITGGIFQNYVSGNVINATDDAVVTLEGTSILDGTSQGLLLDKKATAHLSHVTMATQAPGLIQQKGQSVLTIADSDLSMTPNTTAFQCVRLEMDGVGSIEITDSKLHDCNGGFSGTIPGSLTLTRVEVYSMKFGGLDLGYGLAGTGGIFRITDCNFHDFVYTALRINNGTNDTDIKFRGTKFVNNAASMWDTVTLQTSLGSSLDLGTLADPGGNTFTDANVNQTALRIGVNGTPMKVKAVGNTWTPNVEGADAQGHYSAPAGAGMQLIATEVAAGRNYQVPYKGSTLLLAENP